MRRVTIYMVDRLKQYGLTHPRARRAFGWSVLIFGFVMLVTPLTPGGSLFFVGLEILGLRMVGVERIRAFLTSRKAHMLTE